MKDIIIIVIMFFVLIYFMAQPHQQAEVNRHLLAIHEVFKQILPGLFR